ncbi:D-aminoacyl-tRNA deacylase [hydrothermal vent metagenome]|uniref:D-aminoacyl-tRNA deacylase n=1 Tax=hydrothermal vent metagenome TaxID=652676 RepID=A0A3B1DXE9_9ZZZZ
MRAVVQRVSHASVTVAKEVVATIETGILLLLGVTEDDTQEDIIYLAGKIAGLRIFNDENEKMNLSVREVQGEILVVSQFTLYGDCRKGRRPSFIAAANPTKAKELYLSFVAELRGEGIPVKTGQFQKEMEVSLVNQGPVTLILESRKAF